MAKAPTNRAAGAPPPMGHNQKDVDAAREAQVISYVTGLRGHQATVAKLMAPVTAAKEALNAHVKMAGAAGIPAKLLKELADDGKTSRKDLSKAEQQRRQFRQWLGLPVGDDEDPRLPETVKDEFAWEAEGYQAGMRGDEPKPPTAVPPMFNGKWMEGWHTGDAKRKWAETTVANAPTAPPKPAPAAEPKELTPAEKRRAEKAEEERVKAALNKPVNDEIVDEDPLGVNDALEALREVEPEMVAQVEADHGPARATEPEEMV
jgi:hypothetical protein